MNIVNKQWKEMHRKCYSMAPILTFVNVVVGINDVIYDEHIEQ